SEKMPDGGVARHDSEPPSVECEHTSRFGVSRPTSSIVLARTEQRQFSVRIFLVASVTITSTRTSESLRARAVSRLSCLSASRYSKVRFCCDPDGMQLQMSWPRSREGSSPPMSVKSWLRGLQSVSSAQMILPLLLHDWWG